MMETVKFTQQLLQRIQKIEPENATKIFGFLLLEHSIEEIMEYSIGTEEQIHLLIAEAKSCLMSPDHLHPYISSCSHTVSRPHSSRSSFRVSAPVGLAANPQTLSRTWDHHFPSINPPSPMSVDQFGSFCIADSGFSLRSRSQLGCQYFYKGCCKNGRSCKFFHGQANPNNFNTFGTALNDFHLEDFKHLPGSIEELDMEITKILKAKGGFPISIASLPMLYHEMLGKVLRVEDYLTESPRHGKVGLKLTTLLSRLRNIRILDRPHGQHSIILAEDASKYMEFVSERNDPGASSSHQIYLTFPAESTFTDAEVQNYFNQFGPVHDVRIPRQEKRMFGFVCFYHRQTVRQVLEMGNPHNICGSRVLVKPYKEKSRITAARKYSENFDSHMLLPAHSFDIGNGINTRKIPCENTQLYRKQQIEDNKERHLLEPQCLDSVFETKTLEDRLSSLNIVSCKRIHDEKNSQPGSNNNEQDSLQIQLPESPFASPHFGSNSFYAVI
ncbi:hypothetical protein HPP92_019965 [Vanilla planifolia]|uniref:Zinc finger CCCH domain-containing protein 18-like n=1 Tax=Vanilla planifolia TaxID=51239 RepID=A0A835Q3V8_VANPL|nr:hypothetical protein HPP92_019965 [Vanilla planifolia]